MQHHDSETAASTVHLPYRLVPFAVRGVLGDRPVSAVGTDHELRIDAALHEQAERLRALDRIEDCEFEPRDGAHLASREYSSAR